MTKSPKILILRLSSIGDIVLSTAFIRQIRIHFPKSQIDFVIKKHFTDLVRYNPHINSIHEYDPNSKWTGLNQLKQKIRNQQYDYIFDLHNNYRTKYLTWGLRPKLKAKINKDKLQRAILVYTKINLYKDMLSIPDRYLNVGRKAGIKDDWNGLEIYWKNYCESEINHIFSSNKKENDFLAVAPGAGFFTKRWPLEYFSELIRTVLNKTVYGIFILGSNEEATGFERLKISDRVINLAGKLTLLETAILINRVKVLLTNDSGLMHLATAVRTPVIAIFGSTVKEFGFFPFRGEHIIIENSNLRCRPCSHIGKKTCPKKHFNCMMQIKPEKVWTQLKTRI